MNSVISEMLSQYPDASPCCGGIMADEVGYKELKSNVDEIGYRIKSIRKELGMTQEELAEKAGFRSRSSINKIELGLQKLPQGKIKDVADALQTTPNILMGWRDSSDYNNIEIGSRLNVDTFLAAYWPNYLDLETEFAETIPYVSLDEDNKGTFSMKYMKLLLQISSRVGGTTRRNYQFANLNYTLSGLAGLYALEKSLYKLLLERQDSHDDIPLTNSALFQIV